MTIDRHDATYLHFSVHQEDPTPHQIAARLTGHFHVHCKPHTDWMRGVTTLRIVAPHEAVLAAVELYLAGKPVEYTVTRAAV